MRIFLDGIDASGKSTFAKYLQDAYGFNVIHSNGKCKNDFEFFNNLFNYENTVLDRCHIGEFVYTNVYQRKEKLTKQEYDYLNKKLIHNQDILIIFVCSNLDIIYKRLLDRGENHYLSEMESQEYWYRKAIKNFEKYNYKWKK